MRKAYNKLFIFNIILGSLVLILLVGYLIQQNGITSKGFQIDSLALQLKQSQTTYNNLIIQKASLDRMDEIQQYALQKGMVEAGEVTYIYQSGKVALKKI
jgi:hypothetical protein